MSAAKPREIFVLRLRPGPRVDGIKALRFGLKALRRFGLHAVDAKEVSNDRQKIIPRRWAKNRK
jgi:hypothetical protein